MSKRKNERSWKQLMRQRERMRNGGDARRSGFAFREPNQEDYYGSLDLDDFEGDAELDGYDDDDVGDYDEMAPFDSEDIRDAIPRQSRHS